MAFHSCVCCKKHLSSFLRLLSPVCLSQRRFIPWKSIRTLSTFSSQYFTFLNRRVYKIRRLYHQNEVPSDTDLSAKIDIVHRQAIKDVSAVLKPSFKERRFYAFKLFAKLVGFLVTVGFLNLIFYFRNISPINPPPVPMGMFFGSRKWSPCLERDLKFADVVGCDEAKIELRSLVEFLRSPDSLLRLGARLPRNVLLVGPSGVGKTFLVRAFAGETDIPLIYVNGSEFDGHFVGQGARSMRELFAAAYAKAPCIIFIDSIDSLCSRDTANSEVFGHSQTMNQLLVEMDGFLKNSEKRRGVVIVMGATDRLEVLDPALLRSGRFDVQLCLEPPDKIVRLKLLRHYLQKVKHVPLRVEDVRLLVRRTAGMTGADIANLVNLAAISAALEQDARVTSHHLHAAINRVALGPERSTTGLDPQVRTTTAIHEAGHAVVAFLTENAPEMLCLSLRHGNGQGCTCAIQADPETITSRQSLLARLDVLLGGRVAEEAFLGKGEVSATSAQDLRAATELARKMVFQLGMAPRLGTRFLPMGEDSMRLLSDNVKRLAEAEVSRLLRESRSRVRSHLYAHRKQLGRIVDALEEFELLDAEDLSLLMAGGSPKAAMAKEAELERRISGWSLF